MDVSKGYLVEKSQYDAFYETELEEYLLEKGVGQVVIGGVMTHLCCETTARAAFIRGFDVFFLIDGTATYNEDFHRAALLNLAHGFARPVLCEEILAQIDFMIRRRYPDGRVPVSSSRSSSPYITPAY